ncbi:MAG: PhzF family phenazine biosynthesis protein [Polaribacter sp.]|jgi:PhzF family phenazine biosynthesis protein
MKLNIYQIDAFANNVFEGNPAAVIALTEWLDDSLMQSIAAENNLAETAFFVKEEAGFRIRWFTPAVEVDLCGHATLASAYVLYQKLAYKGASLTFNSRSGPLTISQDAGRYVMDFPTQACQPCEVPNGLVEALACEVNTCFNNEDYLVVLDTEQELLNLQPDFSRLAELDLRGVIVTAPSLKYDFVSRFFAPNVGINEDPVTGSAFTKLIPYWAQRLGKDMLSAKQVSQRGGEVFCQMRGDRVLIAGSAVSYLQGCIEI